MKGEFETYLNSDQNWLNSAGCGLRVERSLANCGSVSKYVRFSPLILLFSQHGFVSSCFSQPDQN